jgi:hypothetical protein
MGILTFVDIVAMPYAKALPPSARAENPSFNQGPGKIAGKRDTRKSTKSPGNRPVLARACTVAVPMPARRQSGRQRRPRRL